MGRNIEQEKKILFFYTLAGIALPLMNITLAYSIIVYVVFGNNPHFQILLAGITGGMWGFGINKFFDYRKEYIEKKPWYSSSAFQKRLQFFRKPIATSFWVIVIEIAIIFYFHLY